jgi:Ala-tRNA(Pro) deacylase
MPMLDLSESEVTALRECLSNAIPNLRMEIASTDQFDFRQGIKHRKEMLEAVLQKLRTISHGHRLRLEAYLREHGVPFETRHHPTAYTATAVAQTAHIPGKMLAKVVILFADGAPVMVTLPCTHQVDLAKARAELQAREVRLAREEEFADLFPDCEVGAMSPFGNLYQMPVLADSLLATNGTIYFQAGTHTDVTSMRYQDFERLVQPRPADVALYEAGRAAA